MKKLFALLFLLYSSVLFADIENKYLVEDIKVSRIDKSKNREEKYQNSRDQ